MARHGACAEIAQLKRKVPDLGHANDPYAFVKLMRQKGYAASLTELAAPKGKAPKGKAVEVKVPEKDLFLVFVTPELCRSVTAK